MIDTRRILGSVQRIGNRLPNPFFLFISLAVIILVLSFWMNQQGVAVHADIVDKSTGKLVNKLVTVKNLLSLEYFHYILKDFTKIYINFAPLGLVMVTLLVVGYVKETGFFTDAMYKVCKVVPKTTVTFMVVLMACTANIASNAGIIISTTVASAIFLTIKRNPIVGAAVGYAVAHAAEPTNLMLTGFMVMMSSITQTAVDAAGIPATVTPLSNYYFLTVSFITLALAITVVVEKVLPKIIQLDLDDAEYERMLQCSTSTSGKITIRDGKDVSRALRLTMIALLAYFGIIIFGLIPAGGFLLNTDGAIVPKSPFISGIVPLLVMMFFIMGTVYGYSIGAIKSCNDIPKMMQAGIHDASAYLVICLPAAFAIKFFSDSNLTTVLSVQGAEYLQAVGISQYGSLMWFILMSAIINLFITSGSAKWLVFAPIVVPMFYRLGIAPEWTQLAYIIGDTVSDPISILNYYIPIVIAIWDKYKKPGEQVGMGSVYSLTLPIAAIVTICLLLQFAIWWILKLPLGL